MLATTSGARQSVRAGVSVALPRNSLRLVARRFSRSTNPVPIVNQQLGFARSIVPISTQTQVVRSHNRSYSSANINQNSISFAGFQSSPTHFRQASGSTVYVRSFSSSSDKKNKDGKEGNTNSHSNSFEFKDRDGKVHGTGHIHVGGTGMNFSNFGQMGKDGTPAGSSAKFPGLNFTPSKDGKGGTINFGNPGGSGSSGGFGGGGPGPGATINLGEGGPKIEFGEGGEIEMLTLSPLKSLHQGESLTFGIYSTCLRRFLGDSI
jgi:hypothetical protein